MGSLAVIQDCNQKRMSWVYCKYTEQMCCGDNCNCLQHAGNVSTFINLMVTSRPSSVCLSEMIAVTPSWTAIAWRQVAFQLPTSAITLQLIIDSWLLQLLVPENQKFQCNHWATINLLVCIIYRTAVVFAYVFPYVHCTCTHVVLQNLNCTLLVLDVGWMLIGWQVDSGSP